MKMDKEVIILNFDTHEDSPNASQTVQDPQRALS